MQFSKINLSLNHNKLPGNAFQFQLSTASHKPQNYKHEFMPYGLKLVPLKQTLPSMLCYISRIMTVNVEDKLCMYVS